MKKSALLVSALLLVTVIFTLSPTNTYAKTKRHITDDSKTYIYMAYGDSFQINIKAIKEKLKVPKSKGKVKIYTNKSSVFKVNQKGLVTVKKSTKNYKNWVRDCVHVQITYKNVVYDHISRFYVYYEYDDDNPRDKNDLKRSLIKKFKKAYSTGNTSKLSKKEKRIFKEAKKAADYACVGKNRYEKAKLLNDYLAANIVYDWAFKKSSHTIESALIKGEAVCEGYTDTFKLCAEMIGIPCERIDGVLKYNRGVAHAWNIVKLEDKKWYHIDVTANDTDTTDKYFPATYAAFCLTDKQMKENYVWYDSKKCNGKKYCFTNYEKNRFIKNDKSLFDAIVSDVNANKKQAVVYLNLSYSAPSVSSLLVSEKCGKQVEIEPVLSSGDETISHWVLPTYVSPDGERYTMHLYKIKYISDTNQYPVKYASNWDQLIEILSDAVKNGETEIRNVAFKEGAVDLNILAEEPLFALFHKHILMYTDVSGETISKEFSPDGCEYTVWNINIDYTLVGDLVYEVSNDVEANRAFSDAASKGVANFYVYAPNYPQEKLQNMNQACNPYPDNVLNFHIQISQYDSFNPCTKQFEPSSWLEVTVTYK